MNVGRSRSRALAKATPDLAAMVERGELSPKLKPFPDVFDLSLQPQTA